MGGCDLQQDSSCLSAKSSIVKGAGKPCILKKVRKRKARAVAKPPIPLLSVDKSTFRDIVLQLTGTPPPPPSSSPPPPPPLACAHTTTPSYPSANPTYDALPNCPLSFANPIKLHTNLLSFANPITPLSNPTTPSPHTSLLHSSPFPLIHGDPTSDTTLRKTLECLQALKQSLLESLLQIKSLRGCGSFNFGMLGHGNHDMISNGGTNYGFDLDPLPRSPVDHTPDSINTNYGECVTHKKSLDLQRAAELERVSCSQEMTS